MADDFNDFGPTYFFGTDASIDRGQRVQYKIMELKERADAVAKHTGVEPIGFFAYERQHPTPRQSSSTAKWSWGGFGALMGFLASTDYIFFNNRSTLGSIAKWTGAGAAIGFVTGLLMKESEAERMPRAIAKYEAYLTGIEAKASEQPQLVAPKEKSHAKKLEAERESAPERIAAR